MCSAPADPAIEGVEMLRGYPCTGKDEHSEYEGSQLSGLVTIPKFLDIVRR